MGPALSPGAVGQEMAACAVLGGVLGAARAVLPTRAGPRSCRICFLWEPC